MSIFNLYKELPLFTNLIQIFSMYNYFLIFFTLGVLFKLALNFKYKYNFKFYNIIIISTLITMMNYYNIFTFNAIEISFLYAISTYYSYKNIDKVSLKWINISMGLMILIIILTYDFFNGVIHHITYPYFSINDILEYHFTYKPYLTIYRPEINDFLGRVDFIVDGEKLTIRNDPIEFRIYMFYYILNSLAITFWLVIYFDILKKHNYKQIIKNNNSN